MCAWNKLFWEDPEKDFASLNMIIHDTLSIHPYYPSLPAGLPNYTLCPHRANVNKFLLVGQHWHVHELGSTEERHSWVGLCFSGSVPHVLFVLHGWFLRWEVSGCTVVLCVVPILLAFMLCTHTEVLIQPQLGRNPLLFHRIDQISIWS